MHIEDIKDRLKREGDNWIERQQAERALNRVDREQRNEQIMLLWAYAVAGTGLVALAVWIVKAVAR